MTNCPCCSNVLLRHVRGNKVYWFCRNCWEVMPAFDEHECVSPKVTRQETLSEKRSTRRKVKEWEIYSAG